MITGGTNFLVAHISKNYPLPVRHPLFYIDLSARRLGNGLFPFAFLTSSGLLVF